MERIWNILEVNPVLTLVLGFMLAVVAMILFKDEIKAYLKKKYNLKSQMEVEKELGKHSVYDPQYLAKKIFEE